MYNLKPLKRINTNTRLSIKIEVKKVGLEMTLEFRDVCNVPNVCILSRIAWPRKPTRRIKQHVASFHTTKVTSHWNMAAMSTSGWYTQSDSAEGGVQNRYGADADWGVLHWDARWRHLANTTETSACGADAALCQITLTTCYITNTF